MTPSMDPVVPQLSNEQDNAALNFHHPVMMNSANFTQHVALQGGTTNGFPMMNFSQKAVFNGGNFTQHISHTIQTSSFDILKESVAPNAFHNSGAEFDPPKCHANTRVAILKRIQDWVYGCDEKTSKYSIMWLNGAAGAGKTAIMHSVIEQLTSKGSGVASFFFWRSDPTRNHIKAFVATLAYQIFQNIPDIRSQILAVIDNDHFLFSRSLSHQFNSIISGPVKNLHSMPRYLVAIDGLDECLDQEAQRHVLETLSAATQQHQLPFVFLIASRPELDIRSTFDTMTNTFTRLTLDNDYQSFKDIDLYLRNNLAQIKKDHPFRRFLSSAWPDEKSIRPLVAKSSGQFIYAATVVKFVKFLRRRPDHSLDILLKLRPSNKDLPFAELDSLYTHILSSVIDVEQVLQAFSYMVLDGGSRHLEELECILSLEKGELEISLCDIYAIISITTGQILFLHASFQDFLLDPVRSNDFYIDLEEHKTKHLINVFQIFAGSGSLQRLTLYNFSAKQLPTCSLSPGLLLEIKKFSLQKLSDDSDTKDKSVALFQRFIPAFYELLLRLPAPDNEGATEDFLDQLDLVILSRISYYYSHTNRFLDVLWIFFHKSYKMFRFPIRSARERFDPLAIHSYNTARRTVFVDGASFDEYLANLLHDHERSKQYAFNTRLFTLAAYDCLTALISFDVTEPLETLSAISTEDDSSTWENLHIFDLVDNGGAEDDLDPTTRDDSRATTHSDLESYRLLAFVLFLLPRSGTYEPLANLCRNPGPCFYHAKKYAGVDLKLNFPIRFGRLICEMNRYLERTGIEEGVMEADCYRTQVKGEAGPPCEVCGRKDRGNIRWQRRE